MHAGSVHYRNTPPEVIGDDSEWLKIRAALQKGDRIWPFTVNANTMATRAGFVFIRHGRPFDVLVTLLS